MPTRKRTLARKTATALAAMVQDSPSVPAPIRARLMELAGRGEYRIVNEIRAALDVLVDELGAQSVERLVVGVGRGVNEVREYTDRDSSTRIRAATELLSLHGVYPSRNAGVSGEHGPVQINITLRGMGEPVPVEVIEVKANSA